MATKSSKYPNFLEDYAETDNLMCSNSCDGSAKTKNSTSTNFLRGNTNTESSACANFFGDNVKTEKSICGNFLEDNTEIENSTKANFHKDDLKTENSDLMFITIDKNTVKNDSLWPDTFTSNSVETLPFKCSYKADGVETEVLTNAVASNQVEQASSLVEGEEDPVTNSLPLSGSQSRLKNDSKEWGPDIFPCAHCNVGFTSKALLDLHMHSLHNCEGETKGSETNWASRHSVNGEKQENGVGTHEETPRRDTTRVSVCNNFKIKEDSDTIMDTKGSLLEKVKGNKSKINGTMCSVCGKSFSKKSNLKSHMIIHSGEKPHTCTECGKSFSQKGNLQIHMRIHNGEKPYICGACDKSFSCSSALLKHTRVHNGHKPYKCDLCEKEFAWSGDHKKHLRTHNGEKPYKCTLCDKAFGQSGGLQAHLRTHNGERPYQCGVCHKLFGRGDSLQVHMKTHIPVQQFQQSVYDDKAVGPSDSTRIYDDQKTQTERNREVELQCV